MAVELDLFDAMAPPPGPAGLGRWNEAVTASDEIALIRRIDAAGLAPFRFQGWFGKRLTRSFGWTYDFDKGTFAKAEPIREWLLPVREIAAATAGLDRDALVQALVIRYDPGAGIGWHKDRPVFQHVVGISLGNPTRMRFRRRLATGFERHVAPLAPRSIYRLSGDVRETWEHSIAAMDEPRWSITFRSLRERPH